MKSNNYSDSYEDNNELILTDDESDQIISNLKDELILESIMEQIDQPFNNSFNNTDYLDLFETRYNYLSEIYRDSSTFINKINDLKENLYSDIFKSITSKYHINYTDNGFDIVECATVLYNFFCLDYKDNIIRYIQSIILSEKKSLANNYADPQYSKSLSANALKKTLKNKNDALIIANINDIIFNIVNRDSDNLEIIRIITNSDMMEYTNNRMYQFFLSDFSMSLDKDFSKIFFNIIINKLDGYSIIINTIKTNLFNLFPKKV